MSSQPASFSSSIPPTSSKGLPPPPPGGAPNQKKNTDATKKSTSTSHTGQGSGGSLDSTVMISNNELFAVIERLTQQVSQNQEDNKTLLGEIERMRAEMRKSQETPSSTLQPRILNFDNA